MWWLELVWGFFWLEEGSYAALAPAQVVILHGVEDYGADTLIPVSSSWRHFTVSSALHILCHFTCLCYFLLCSHAGYFTSLDLNFDKRIGLWRVRLEELLAMWLIVWWRLVPFTIARLLVLLFKFIWCIMCKLKLTSGHTLIILLNSLVDCLHFSWYSPTYIIFLFMHLSTIYILLYLNAFWISTFILFGRVYYFPI